ncbi:hypothetical protein ACK1CN_25590 [Vibrio coralliilyticus]|uniref:hypothetical protein n=1 Tax=Vibrio coralliilyticus TaxID=190893 RepID=UPI003917134A
MNPIIAKLKDANACERFKSNALKKGEHELAKLATIRMVQFRAEEYGAEQEVERHAIEAVCAYEVAQSVLKGKKTRANRTWKMIKDHGILNAVERAVNRNDVTQGYQALEQAGLEQFTFEAVILKFPEFFSPEAIEKSEQRVSVDATQSSILENNHT